MFSKEFKEWMWEQLIYIEFIVPMSLCYTKSGAVSDQLNEEACDYFSNQQLEAIWGSKFGKALEEFGIGAEDYIEPEVLSDILATCDLPGFTVCISATTRDHKGNPNYAEKWTGLEYIETIDQLEATVRNWFEEQTKPTARRKGTGDPAPA